MDKFIIAAAQSSSVKGNISENISIHQKYIDAAYKNNVNVVVFPELSLTGYEPDIAKEKALYGNEDVLIPLLNSAARYNITIITGCPIRSNNSRPYIGALIIQPSQKITIYRKRYLHAGEENYFIPSSDRIIYRCKEENIGIAICADIDNPAHPEDLKKLGATIYTAGVLITPKGLSDAHNKLSSYAKKHRMVTLMSNYATESGGYQTGGGSAIWDEEGNLIVRSQNVEEALIIARKENNVWKGKEIRI
jgi:predicted amidohydrolase